MPNKNQKRDKNGRFASGSSSGFAASRLAEFGKRAAIGAAGIGAGYAAARLISSVGKSQSAPTSPPPTTQPHNRSISLGHGVRIKGAQVSTLEQAAQVALNNTRNHGFVAHSSDKLRTAKSLEKLALVERRAHPDGTPESAARKPHYVITRQGVDALVKSGLLTTKDRDKWERARGRESFNNNL